MFSKLLFFLLSFVFSQKNLFLNPINGKFKILQVSDFHFGRGKGDKCQDVESTENCDSYNTSRFVLKVFQAEQPDLVVYTGDQIDGDCPDYKKGYDEVFKMMTEQNPKKIPWIFVLGNHDGQGESTAVERKTIFEYGTKKKNCISYMNDPSIDGVGNNKFIIYATNSTTPVFEIFTFDSLTDSDDPLVSGYDRIRPSQVNWFMENKKDLNLNSMAFFHIPLQEYTTMLDEEIPISGDNNEVVCPSVINSGLFSAFIIKRLKILSTGHDHTNDFCGRFHETYLCYAGGCGYKIYGRLGWPRRVRLFEIDKKGSIVTTWKRLDDNSLSTKDYEVLLK